MQRKIWTSEEIEYLKSEYPNTQTRLICKHLGRSFSSVFGQAYSLKLSKSEAFKQSFDSGRMMKGSLRGYEHRFKKGQPTWNKGLKGLQIGGVETQFSKGHLPHNTKQDGVTSIRYSKGRPYVWKRVGLGKWKELHRLLWEEHNGPIPEGFNIQFKDKNSLNVVIDNLYIISRKTQLSEENSIQRYPEDIKSAIRTLGKLKRTIKKKHEKQD